jgi:hypothetical protein
MLDDSFSFGSSIMTSMTNVLNTCTTRLAYHENMALLTGLHASGLSTGRVNSHQGSTPLHTKVSLSLDMTSDSIELHDNNYTAIVTDGGGQIQLNFTDGRSNNSGSPTSLKNVLNVLNSMEWSVSFASDGPTKTNRRSDHHPWSKHLHSEIDLLYCKSNKSKSYSTNAISNTINVGKKGAFKSLARVLDFMHPLNGKRLTGIISKQPHNMESILINRCQLLGYGNILKNINKNRNSDESICHDIVSLYERIAGETIEKKTIFY